MAQETFYLLAPPAPPPPLHLWQGVPVRLAYQLGEDMSLLRLPGCEALRGGCMALSDCTGDPTGDPRPLCRQIEGECIAHGYQGVLLDLDRRLPPWEGLVARLAPILERRSISLFLPEYYAPLAPRGKVLLSSALSGGSLTRRLEEALERFGRERLVLAVERAAEDFALPALTGCGTPLTPPQLEEWKHRLRPSIFFSPQLCARYFTYCDRTGGVHFVLFDDMDTLVHKVQTARQLGITAFLLPWAEVCPAPQRFGLLPRPGQKSPQNHPR